MCMHLCDYAVCSVCIVVCGSLKISHIAFPYTDTLCIVTCTKQSFFRPHRLQWSDHGNTIILILIIIHWALMPL